jgi:hypothetical protein
MAVIEELGCTVQICAKEVPLQEYDDPDPDPKEMSTGATTICNKYVEARDGVQFNIRVKCRDTLAWLNEDPNNALHFDPYIDGHLVDGCLARSKNFKNKSYCLIMDEVTETLGSTGYERVRKFSFASIRTGRFHAAHLVNTCMLTHLKWMTATRNA